MRVVLCATHEAAPKLCDALTRAVRYIEHAADSSGPEIQAERHSILDATGPLLRELEQARTEIPTGAGWRCWVFSKGDDFPCGYLNEGECDACRNCGAPRSDTKG